MTPISVAYKELSKISPVLESPRSGVLYVSGLSPLDTDPAVIQKLGITAIVACLDRNSVVDVHDKIIANNPGLSILYLPYDDEVNQNLWVPNNNTITLLENNNTMEDYEQIIDKLKLYNNKPLIEIGYHFIEQALANNQRVLVHCMAGVSRSVSIVAYYLMKKYGFTLTQALATIRKKRSIANPNASFTVQLTDYQYKRDKASVSTANDIIEKINAGKIVLS